MAEKVWGWHPHAAQRQLFCSGASVRVAACGRRWGKTESLSIDAATLALAMRGSRQLIVAPTEFQARLLGEAVQDRLDHAFRHGDPDGLGRDLAVRARPHLILTIKEPEAGTAESQILCRTAGRDGRNLRGLWAHRIIVDEAAYVPDRVLKEVLPPMLADKGGEFLLASSPNGRRAAFYTLYARGQSVQRTGGVSHASFQCATKDNPHLDKSWLRSQREEMGELLYGQEFEAKFIDDYGMVFREEDIDAAAAGEFPDIRLEDNEVHSEAVSGRDYIMGADWGRKYDYTVIVVLDATKHPFHLVHLSRWRGTSWNQQAADTAEIVTRFQPQRILVDGNSMGDPIANMLDKAIQDEMKSAPRRPTVEQFTFGSESKQALIDRLNVGLDARMLRFPRHPALINELKNFEYAPGGPGRLKMAARGTGHDDCVIALALAFYAAPDPAAHRKDLGVMLGSQLGLGQWE